MPTATKEKNKKCSYCGKESNHLITKTIWVNETKEDREFCDEDCAFMAQCSAEG